MAKVPRAGNVKTRLLPFLAPEQCRDLAEAFLLDAMNKTRNLCDELIIAFAPAHEKDYFAGVNVENLTLIEQRGADLGEKMFNALEFALRRNSDASVVIIGTDSPTFPPEFVAEAFEKLVSKAKIVLGASEDGGFYLIGLRKNLPNLFKNIEWSSPQVYEQITWNITQSGYILDSIPVWYDVDTPDDLRHLRDEILGSKQAQKVAPQTFRWLSQNEKR